MSRLIRTGGLALSLVLLSAVLGWARADVALADDDWVQDPAPRGTVYVAMGDSYSSGEGLGNYGTTDAADDQCHRSGTAYSTKVLSSDKSRLITRVFAACSGSQTADLYTPMYNGEPRSQMDQLSASTAAVTLSVGGNDLGFVPVLRDCVYTDNMAFSIFVQGRKNCENRQSKIVNAALQRYQVTGKPRATGNRRLVDVLSDIHRRSPKADIYVAGYPRLFGMNLTTRSACQVGTVPGHSAKLWIAKSDTEWLNSVVDRLNSAIETTVKDYMKSLPIHYVSVWSRKDSRSFYGHALCDDKAAWINKLSFPKGSNDPETKSFHPTQSGADAYAYEVTKIEKPTLPPQILPTETFRLAIGTTVLEAGMGLRGGESGTWRIVAGALPPGLSMGGDGRIAGSATEVGDYRVTMQFTRPDGASDTAGYRVLVTGDESQQPVRWKSTTGLVSANILECPQVDSCYAFSSTQVSRSIGGVWQGPVDLPDVIGGDQHAASCPSVDFCAIATQSGTFTSTDMVNWKRGTTYSDQVVSCPATTFCMSVGSWHSGPRAWLYGRDTWTAAIDQPGLVVDLSCTSETFCAAVNYNGDRMIYDGRTWSYYTDPQRSQYVRVDCKSSSDCTAGTQGGQTSTWNGTAWTDRAALPVNDYVQAIDCSDQTCHLSAGVGLFARDANSTWALGTIAELPEDRSDAYIKDLACTGPEFCYALFTGGGCAGGCGGLPPKEY